MDGLVCQWNMTTDYDLKTCIFIEVVGLWISGRTAQKIRLLILKNATTAEMLTVPTNK